MNIKKLLYNTKFIRLLYFKFFRSFRNQRDVNLYLLRKFNFNFSIDVGANKGLYSIELEKISKKVFIFEPIKILYDDLCKILSKKTQKFNYALGSASCNKRIKIPILRNSLSYGRASISQTFNNYIWENIKVRSLNYLIKKKKINFKNKKVDFIKIDVEGYEYQVIKGAVNFLKKYKPIILIELESRTSNNLQIKKIFSLLEKLNYKSFYTQDGINFKANSFSDIKYLQSNNFYKKDILKERRLKKGQRRYYICNFWFFPKKMKPL